MHVILGFINNSSEDELSTRRTIMNNSQDNKKEGHDHNKEFTIIVNGREKVVTKKEMSFAEIVALANLPSGPNIVYTVTYRRGEGNKPEGTLVEGDSVKIKEGIIFNVTATDKS
jgi:Multiubiquitin